MSNRTKIQILFLLQSHHAAQLLGPPFMWWSKGKGASFPSFPRPSALAVELLAIPSHYTRLPPNPWQPNVANGLAFEHMAKYTGDHRLIYSLSIHKWIDSCFIIGVREATDLRVHHHYPFWKTQKNNIKMRKLTCLWIQFYFRKATINENSSIHILPAAGGY